MPLRKIIDYRPDITNGLLQLLQMIWWRFKADFLMVIVAGGEHLQTADTHGSSWSWDAAHFPTRIEARMTPVFFFTAMHNSCK